jgi:hypothetical protein
MSDTPQTLAALVLVQKYRGPLVNLINRTSVTAKILPVVMGTGKNCSWGLKTTGIVSENFSEGADAANFGSNTQTPATLNWGLYRGNAHVTGTARRAAALSETPEGQQDILSVNVMDAVEDLTSRLNIAFCQGPGTGTTIAGWDVALGDTANTYAGIDRSQVANLPFRPYVVDPGSPTQLTFAQVRADLTAIQKQSGRRPQIALVSLEVYNAACGMFDATRLKFEDLLQTSKGPVQLDHSQRGVIVENCMFIPDKDITAGEIVYLPPGDDAVIEYLPPAPVSRINEAMLQLTGSPIVPAQDGFGQAPLGFEVQPLAKLGDSDRFSVVSNLQLVVRRPNAGGIRKNVLTA